MRRPQCSFRACALIAGICMAGAPFWPDGAAAASGALHANVPDAYVRPAADAGDQADMLQHALDALQPGQRLVFAPGRYVVGRSLVVRQPNVVVSGYGATLIATNADDQTVGMRGDGTTLVGFRLAGTGTTRLTTPESTKVVVTGRGVQVLDNVIDGGAGAGIFVFGGADVAIVGNEVLSTLADGIHMTHGSRDVLVRGNVVRGTGDDMIAVVSYQAEGVLTRNVLITGNSLEGNPWGRGITVVGGANVTISNNIVRNVQVSAGILVAQEDSNHTYGASDVRIENNVIADIQTATGRTDPRPITRQAAIEVSTWSGSVSRVTVIGNRVSNARFDGIRLWGNVSGVRLADNQLSGIGGMPVRVGPGKDCASDGPSRPSANAVKEATCATARQSTATGADALGADPSSLPHVREAVRQARWSQRSIE
ncbi:right-handed parallel beta-helix repeat-containing protein [Burkholderia ambifaria]|uniref:right-handed parallel beta-helix repeat-containing protein n=1 Tax=Burkholderia ambifaria TaxID=152480 RepID=UPI00158A3D59|nr:right-handed parallel beta-helix repeat-containing protein [Burkholderia ambifaria]WDR88195.1 right-handed parallel beta-helix repeat-containing protein [Burkholderia ambifaria]WDS00926.1 right-handed parallel beta-helix repeat-containing protein [Burkholderia ambifaria]